MLASYGHTSTMAPPIPARPSSWQKLAHKARSIPSPAIAARVAWGAFAYAGQVCIKVQRLFVHESIYRRFVRLVAAATKALAVGDPADPATVVGPLIDDAAVLKAEWFAGIGTKDSKGTKVFAVAGRVKKTGLVEVPMGTPLRRIIFDLAGGIKKDREFKAVITSGPGGSPNYYDVWTYLAEHN